MAPSKMLLSMKIGKTSGSSIGLGAKSKLDLLGAPKGGTTMEGMICC